MRLMVVLSAALAASACSSQPEPMRLTNRAPSAFDAPLTMPEPQKSRETLYHEADEKCRQQFAGKTRQQVISRVSCSANEALGIWKGTRDYDLVAILQDERLVLAERLVAKKITLAEAKLDLAKLMSDLKARSMERSRVAQVQIDERQSQAAAEAHRQAAEEMAQQADRSASGMALLSAGLGMMAGQRQAPLVLTTCTRLGVGVSSCLSQ